MVDGGVESGSFYFCCESLIFLWNLKYIPKCRHFETNMCYLNSYQSNSWPINKQNICWRVEDDENIGNKNLTIGIMKILFWDSPWPEKSLLILSKAKMVQHKNCSNRIGILHPNFRFNKYCFWSPKNVMGGVAAYITFDNITIIL